MTFRMYVAKRILIAIVTLWLVATINFLFLYSDEGILSKEGQIEPAIVDILRKGYGIGEPWINKYFKYLQSLFSFGLIPPYFGYSTLHCEFVATGLARTLPITLLLLGSALVVMISLGIVIGAIAASRRGTKLDIALTSSSIFTWCIPTFVLQTFVIVLVFQVLWSNGVQIVHFVFKYPPSVDQSSFVWWLQVYWQLFLPILTLAATGIAYWVLTTRNMLVQTLQEDYIVTARAKGLSDRKVVFRHGLRAVYPQIATMIASSFPSLITGSIVTEYLFGIDGIGKYCFYAFFIWGEGTKIIIDSVALQAVVFIFTALTVLCNLTADIFYGIMDPRIRIGARPHKR